MYYKLIDKVIVFLKKLCNHFQSNWDILLDSIYLVHYYCYYKSPKEFSIYNLATIAFFISHCKIWKKIICLESLVEVEIWYLKTNNFNFDYGVIKYEYKDGNQYDLVNMEIEIYTFLGFDIQFLSPFNYVVEFLQKFKIDNAEKVRRLANIIIYDIVSRPIIIYYPCEYLAISTIYYSLFIRNYTDTKFTISKFVDSNNLMCFNNDLLTCCIEDIKEFYLTNLG